nr:hypothetical protein [Tanacetum cinerariifolium]
MINIMFFDHPRPPDKEDLFTYCIKNGILQDFQDASEPSNDNTNVVNVLQDPFVVKQDPGAHYGYNCPPKVLIIPDPESFNNQTVDELPQTVPSFDPTCYSEDGNSFTYDSKSNLVDDSPNVFNLRLQTLIYSYEFCGNDAYYGHDCPLQFPVIHQPIRKKTCAELLAEEQAANINTQPFQYLVVPQPPQEDISVKFLQEKRNQIDYETILEIELAFEDKRCQPEDILELFRRLHNDEQNIHEELAVYINNPSWDRLTVCYNNDDDEDYTIAITPKELDNSLSMGDEHLDTIPTMESDEFIKSSVENLVPNPKSLLNHDSMIISSSSKIDSLLDEFAGELILLKSIPSGINKTDCAPEDEIHLIKRLLYDNSSPHILGFRRLMLKDFVLQSSFSQLQLGNHIPAYYDDDDDYNFAITPNETIDSLIMGDEHLETVPAIESDELIKSSVENLVPNPSESEGENSCDMLACFTTFSNILFDAEYEFDSVDDQSLHNEDFSKKIFSNPLFEEEISSIKKNQHHFNA